MKKLKQFLVVFFLSFFYAIALWLIVGNLVSHFLTVIPQNIIIYGGIITGGTSGMLNGLIEILK